MATFPSTAHPRMYNCLWSGVDTAGLCGVVLATAANTNVYVAVVYMRLKKFLVDWDSSLRYVY
jgi:hypothetical protein